MPRGPRLDAPGTLHHVMVRGIEKKPIVDDNGDRAAFIERLGLLSQDLQTPVYAWALMDNHAHILLRSGPQGLSDFMRKLLTGYAVFYNRRHDRHGHLFQNRYKSIVVQEDPYFKQLVRYIHLNPLRAGLVESIAKLDYFRWCGHSALVGRRKSEWQDTGFVLSCFGRRQKQGQIAYRRFIKEGIALGRQPQLVGGGLVRSAGGWSEVKSLRRLGVVEKGDERILGSGAFVKQILKETDLSNQYRIANLDRGKAAEKMIKEGCRSAGIQQQALYGGSRQRRVSRLRQRLAYRLTDELGLSLAETARLLGVSTSAVAKIRERRKDK